MKVRTNMAGGILFLVLSITILILIPYQIASSQTLTIGNDPRLMPQIVAIIILLCSLGLIFKSLVLKKEDFIEVHLPDEKNALYAGLLMLGYLVCIFITGFFVSSIIMVIVFLLFFKEKKSIPYIILCVLSAGVWLLFVKIFNVPLTGGLLFK
jgi:putative tricarboxylic transport membrane protein